MARVAAHKSRRTTPKPARARRQAKTKIVKHSPRKSGDGTRGSGRTADKPHAHDAIALLEADHRKVKGLLERLANAQGESRRQPLLKQIEAELKMHTKIEEEIFYPAFRDAVGAEKDRKLYFEAMEEHRAADLILADTKKADIASEVFAGRAKVLKEVVEHHADEEEEEMFPRARRVLEPEQLRELGARMAEMKRAGAGSGGALKAVASYVGLA